MSKVPVRKHHPLKAKNLYMIGNAHIDPVWLWQWQEGMQEIKATFRSALDRLQEYDDFVFIASSAAFYAWIEENEPAMFEEIQSRVAEGRWELVGGWWIEPDCNIPGGEALVRQGLYGQRYFLSRFGKYTRVGYNPDSFGHHGALPQILKRSGLDYYILMRPGPHENETLHPVFWWEADDGSQVLTYRIPFSYTVWGELLESHVRHCTEDMDVSANHTMCFYGVGNHGGGPTRQNIDLIHALNNSPDMPRLTMSTTQKYFDSMQSADINFPVVHNELQYHARGCYAAHSGIKRWNRKGENALIVAEKWASLANWITGLTYPKEELEKAWKMLLFNQFHDILAGTSIEGAYDDAQNTFGSVITTADRVRNAAMQKLSWSIATSPLDEGIPLVVFNPHAWESTVPAEIELGWFDHAPYSLVDASGVPVETQKIHPHTSLIGSTRLCFIANLPPLGYHTYRLVRKDPDTHNQDIQSHHSETEWENQWFRIMFDATSGCITGLYDKKNGCHVFDDSAARAVVIDDPSDTWSHGVDRYDQEVADFRGEEITVLEQGAVKTTVRISSVFGSSRLMQDFTLYNAIPRIDVQVTVDWHEKFKMLKLCFPLKLTHATATYEIPYGHIVRPANGDEEPGQSWLDVTGIHLDLNTQYGLSLLNNGKYSFSVESNELRLTVLRSPIYAQHTPYTPDPEGLYTFIDQGIQTFSYALLPHAGTWKDARTIQHAAEINQPVFILKETHHPWGNLSQNSALLSVTPENIVVSAVKLAEDNDDLIIRCHETQNTQIEAHITLFAREEPINVNFSPGEIKTLRIPADRRSPVAEQNLLECPQIKSQEA